MSGEQAIQEQEGFDLRNEKDKNTIVSNLTISSLTEVEVEGLKSRYNFADGHAYHTTPRELEGVMNNLNSVWNYARSKTIPQMEEQFKATFADLIESPTLLFHPYYSILPTASNSIDTVGAWLNMRGYSVGLIEPAFDNLFLMLKRRGVKIRSIQQEDTVDLERLGALVDEHRLESLFTVMPNNPTGFDLSMMQFKALCEFCSDRDLTLIVDRTFRFYTRNQFDDYKVLDESGVDYIVVEDTGKTWATQDLKASLLVYSASLAAELRVLYEEIFLCSSNFTLALLTQLIEATKAAGIERVVWREVTKRMTYVEQALAGTPLEIASEARGSCLPLVWVDCGRTGLSDLEVARRFKEYGIVVLPGRYFYWNSHDERTDNIRLSLMRPEQMLLDGLTVFSEAARRIF